MIEIKTTSQTRQVLLNIQGMGRKFHQGLYIALAEIGDEFVREEIRLEKRRDKTGRLYYSRGGLRRASAPNEVPALRTGRLAASTGKRVHSPLFMTFGQEEEYAKFLAEGTRKMSPRANLRQAVQNKAGFAGLVIMDMVNREAKLK